MYKFKYFINQVSEWFSWGFRLSLSIYWQQIPRWNACQSSCWRSRSPTMSNRVVCWLLYTVQYDVCWLMPSRTIRTVFLYGIAPTANSSTWGDSWRNQGEGGHCAQPSVRWRLHSHRRLHARDAVQHGQVLLCHRPSASPSARIKLKSCSSQPLTRSTSSQQS